MPKKKASQCLQTKKGKEAALTRWQQHGQEEEIAEQAVEANIPSTSVPPPEAIQTSSLPTSTSTPSTSAPGLQPIPSTSRSQEPGPIPSTSSAPEPEPIPYTSSATSPFRLDIPITPRPIVPQSPPPPLSRSQKKLQLSEQYIREDIEEGSCVRTVVEIDQIKKLIASFICPTCQHEEVLTVNISRQYGLSLKLDITCTRCNAVVTSQYTSARKIASQSRPRPFVVNEAVVLASLLVSMGAYNLKNFCEYLEMPGMHQKTFNTIASRIYSQNKMLGQTIFSQAARVVRQEHIAHYSLDLGEDDLLDISLCFDGSWLTRGHKSLVGIGSVIDVLTGLVPDAHVLSLYCAICAKTGAWIKRETPQRYNRWKADHVARGECTINFEGTSGMMEVEAAVVLWRRSVEKHRPRYITMVSDGDSKVYNKIVETQPYGPDVTIAKEDCLNHVGKRCGTALRNLVSDCSKRGVTLGGRGLGRLTAETMKKLQIYYSRAIRGHKTAAEMKTAIYASLFHGYSTDDMPQHQYCPSGKSSWCFFKRAIGEHNYPTGHNKRVHTPLDYKLFHKHLEPIYKRFTADDLLKRCELKATQNPSESFHHSGLAAKKKTCILSQE